MDELRIGIAVWEGVEELDFAGPYEVLTAWANESERPISVRLVAHSSGVVRCAHGLRVVPDLTWDEVDGLDVVLLPGGNSQQPICDDDSFLERMRGLAASGALMTSVCTGALVYAQAGLLDGRPATTHWSALERLAELGRDVRVNPEARYVDDGDVITAAGVSAGIDMALHLIVRLDSVERAQAIRRYIQYDPQPPV
jgi:transcriptional regulator GlxA family with amidase domain